MHRASRLFYLLDLAYRAGRRDLSNDEYDDFVKAQREDMVEVTGDILRELNGARERNWDSLGMLLRAIMGKLGKIEMGKKDDTSPTLLASADPLRPRQRPRVPHRRGQPARVSERDRAHWVPSAT